MIKAVIFDYDGVIADSLPVVFQIYDRIGEHFGIKEFKNLKDGNFFDVHWPSHFNKVGVTSKETLDQAEKFFAEELAKLNKQIELFENVDFIVKSLSKKYKLGIVSNAIKVSIEQKLKEKNLLHYFSAIIGHEHKVLKPDPRQLMICMELMGVKPEETVYIGDMEGDILAARNAKLNKVIGASYGYHSPHRLKNADIIVDRPEMLLEVL